MTGEAAEHARKLLDQHGPQDVWRIATVAALDAHLNGLQEQRDHWRDVLHALRLTAPRPGCSELDIRRSASVLIGQHGPHEAWHRAMQRATELDHDMVGQVVMLRVADAVAELWREQRKEDDAGGKDR